VPHHIFALGRLLGVTIGALEPKLVLLFTTPRELLLLLLPLLLLWVLVASLLLGCKSCVAFNSDHRLLRIPSNDRNGDACTFLLRPGNWNKSKSDTSEPIPTSIHSAGEYFVYSRVPPEGPQWQASDVDAIVDSPEFKDGWLNVRLSPDEALEASDATGDCVVDEDESLRLRRPSL
jgi:hypothetical protein